jgi:hypothetical protein
VPPQVVGLGVDSDRRTTDSFGRAAHVGMEMGPDLVRRIGSRFFVEKIR